MAYSTAPETDATQQTPTRGPSGRADFSDSERREPAGVAPGRENPADKLADQVLDKVLPGSVQNKHAARRKIGKYVALGLSLGIAALAIFVLTQTLMAIDMAKLRQAITKTSFEQIGLALMFTCISFLALTGYDALALRQLKLRVPYRTTALASFTSYAVSFTLGFPLITAGTVRYWIYSTKGLSAGKVASLTVIAGLTFWLGMALVIGIGFAIRPNGISHIDHLDPLVNRLIGIGVILALAGYLAWAARGKRRATISGFTLELPGFGLTLGQIGLGLIDLCAAAGVLYALIAAPRQIDYITFVAVYVFGSLIGIASNAPGGIVVFDATMLKIVPGQQDALFAALLLFRIIYYLLPFAAAVVLLGFHGGFRRWKAMRQAMEHRDDEAERVD